MYFTLRKAFFLLLLILLVIGCGKGNKHGTQSTLSGNIAKGTSNPVIDYLPATGNGLRPDISFDYNYSGYTSKDGLTVVPMSDDVTPADPNLSDLSLTVTGDENGKQVDIFLA